MANPARLYRFRLTVSDVDRGFYESLDFRAAMHPSESEAYLLTRVLAYSLNYESGLEFAPGLSSSDEPALHLLGPNGIALWIEIGNPSSRKLHKAAKASKKVRVYTYKDPESLKKEAAGQAIHRAGEIEVFALGSPFLNALAGVLQRDNEWGLIHNDGELTVTVGEESILGSITQHSLDP